MHTHREEGTMNPTSKVRRQPGQVSLLCALIIAATIGIQGVARATDYNIDYVGTVGSCAGPFGGAALEISGPFLLAAGSPYYIDKPGFNPNNGTCGSNTWVTWGCLNTLTSTACATGFDAGTSLHLGVTLDNSGGTATLVGQFVFNNAVPWDHTTSIPPAPCTSLTSTCGLMQSGGARPTAASSVGDYACLGIAPFGVWVHADGKTLVVVSGSASSPACPCREPLYLGKLRYEYYGVRQALSTLNSKTGREPSHVDTVAGGVLACGETLVVVNDANQNEGPPADARFVVVNGVLDSVATVDSPRATRFWVQEVIVHEGEHLLTASAGEHGTIDPRGPVVVADGGSQTFTMVPDAEFRVKDVTVDGVSVGPVMSYTLSNVTGDHTIIASFAPLNSVPDCSHVAAVPSSLWPPNHKLVPVTLTGASDPDGDPVHVKITRITQDEPTGPPSNGPTAVVDETGACQLRSERDGGGNGRVYTIWYTADDGSGGACDGSVQVCVPHDRGHSGCVDDGQRYDAYSSGSSRGDGGQHVDKKSRRLALAQTTIQGNEATVEFSIPDAGVVLLAVYDISGRRVATVEHSAMGEGSHKSVWNVGGLPRGIYYYRLRSGPGTVSKSLLVLK
jgi:hypothetical protein